MIRRSPLDPATQIDAHVLADVFAHPLRGRVLTALSEHPRATIQAAAQRLKESPRRVRQQVDALLDLGLVEVTGEETHRGVLQRRYGAGPIIVRDVDSLSDGMRMAMAKAIIRLLMGDIGVAASAGTLGRRADDFEIRMYGEVDEACLEELAGLHRRAYREILEAIEDGRERVRDSGRRGTEVISALFFFEAPIWGPRPPRPSGRGTVRRKPSLPTSDAPVRRSMNDPSMHPDPQALVKAYDQPVRGKVLTALAERPDVTIREIAEHLEEPPRRVRHHIETLLEAGLVAVTSSENLSGVIQHRYGAGPLVVDDVELWSREERTRFSNATVRLLAADLGVAASAGTIARRADDFETRIYGEVDGACLDELADLCCRADRGIRKAMYEGRERVRRSGATGTEVISALFFFEAPLWNGPGMRG